MIEYKQQFIKIFQKIYQADNILLVCHKKPDGDCLGAVCALGNYFDEINKKHTIFNIDKVPNNLNYLKGVDKVSNDFEKIKNDNFDLVLVLDTGSLDYSGVGEFLEKIKEDVCLVNIDHHVSNTHYGHYNLVISTASSASEIVYSLFKHNKIFIKKDVANCLLTGIISDSGGFANAATTISSIDAASYLLTHGATIPKIIKNTFQNQSLSSLKLWGLVLSRLENNKKYDIAYTYITYKDMEKYNAKEEDIEGVANFLNNLEDSKAMMFIKEKKPGEISVSMRTTNDLIDLSKLARIVGGGGHKKASGFSLVGSIREDGNRVKIV